MQALCNGLGILGISCQSAQPELDVVRQNFMNHINSYGISYGTREELEFRFQIYLEKDMAIKRINSE